MSDQELLQCPFCGENETEVAENVTGDIVSGRQVECQYCSARGPEVLSSAKANTAWNTRATSPLAAGADSAAIKKALREFLADAGEAAEDLSALQFILNREDVLADRISAALTRTDARMRALLAEATEAIGVCIDGFEKSNPTLGGLAAIHLLKEARDRYRTALKEGE